METTFSKYKPFRLVTRDDKKVVVVAGNVQAMPQEFTNINEAENYLKNNTYEVCINLITLMLGLYEKDKQEQMAKDAKKNA